MKSDIPDNFEIVKRGNRMSDYIVGRLIVNAGPPSAVPLAMRSAILSASPQAILPLPLPRLFCSIFLGHILLPYKLLVTNSSEIALDICSAIPRGPRLFLWLCRRLFFRYALGTNPHAWAARCVSDFKDTFYLSAVEASEICKNIPRGLKYKSEVCIRRNAFLAQDVVKAYVGAFSGFRGRE